MLRTSAGKTRWVTLESRSPVTTPVTDKQVFVTGRAIGADVFGFVACLHADYASPARADGYQLAPPAVVADVVVFFDHDVQVLCRAATFKPLFGIERKACLAFLVGPAFEQGFGLRIVLKGFVVGSVEYFDGFVRLRFSLGIADDDFDDRCAAALYGLILAAALEQQAKGQQGYGQKCNLVHNGSGCC